MNRRPCHITQPALKLTIWLFQTMPCFIYFIPHTFYIGWIWVFIAECLLSNKRKLTKSLFSLTRHLCNVRLFLTGKPIRIVKDDKNRRRGKTLHISTLSSSTHFLCGRNDFIRLNFFPIAAAVTFCERYIVLSQVSEVCKKIRGWKIQFKAQRKWQNMFGRPIWNLIELYGSMEHWIHCIPSGSLGSQ